MPLSLNKQKTKQNYTAETETIKITIKKYKGIKLL